MKTSDIDRLSGCHAVRLARPHELDPPPMVLFHRIGSLAFMLDDRGLHIRVIHPSRWSNT